MLIALLQKGVPDNYQFITFIFIILLFFSILLLISTLFDWIKSKPWKREVPPDQRLTDEDSTHIELPDQNIANNDNNYKIDGSIILKHI